MKRREEDVITKAAEQGNGRTYEEPGMLDIWALNVFVIWGVREPG